MTSQDLPITRRKHGGREQTRQADGVGEVIGGAFRLGLPEEPERLLGEGERRWPFPGPPLDARPHLLGGAADPRLDGMGEGGHGGSGEEAAQRQVDAEALPHAREQSRGQQRVSAELEEVVFNPHLVDVQDVGPEPGQGLLDKSAGG